MNIIRAVCRIEKATKKPAIFYWENTRNHHMCGNDLTCYTFEEQHTSAAPEYYRTGTKPAEMPADIAACERLVKHYALICSRHREMLVIGKRLTRK